MIGPGWRAGSARTWLSPPGVVSLRFRLTQTLLQRWRGDLSYWSSRLELPPTLPAPPRAPTYPHPRPVRPYPPSPRNADSLGSKASLLASCASFLYSKKYERGGKIPAASSQTRTPPPLDPDKSRCTLTSDSTTSSRRELSGAFPATRARRGVRVLLRLRSYLFPSLSATFLGDLHSSVSSERKSLFLAHQRLFPLLGELRRRCCAPETWDFPGCTLHGGRPQPFPHQPRHHRPLLSPTFDFLVRGFGLHHGVCLQFWRGRGACCQSSARAFLSALPAFLSPGLTRPNQRPWCTVPAAKGPSWTASS